MWSTSRLKEKRRLLISEWLPAFLILKAWLEVRCLCRLRCWVVRNIPKCAISGRLGLYFTAWYFDLLLMETPPTPKWSLRRWNNFKQMECLIPAIISLHRIAKQLFRPACNMKKKTGLKLIKFWLFLSFKSWKYQKKRWSTMNPLLLLSLDASLSIISLYL